MWKRALKIGAAVLILVNIALSAVLLSHNFLHFHSDIARDFLLVEDVVKNHALTLIGPRAGGIPGVFHGPLWIYVNLPVFYLTHGNPDAVSYFWFVLNVVSIGVVYVVARKVYDENVALLSTLMYSAYAIFYPTNMFNPFGGVLLSPIFLYLFWQYLQKYNVKYLISALFVLGLIIQFQMAFGVPVLVSSFAYLIVHLFKQKKMKHLLSYFILPLPLSSFILFDLRNNFLQLRSAILYTHGDVDYIKIPFSERVGPRLYGFLIDGFGFFTEKYLLLTFPVVVAILFLLYKDKLREKDFWRSFNGLWLYFYSGFWLLSVLFSGRIWGYYYWQFLPIILIVLASLFNRKLFKIPIMLVAIITIYIAHTGAAVGYMQRNKDFSNDSGSWVYSHNIARELYKDAPSEFGYYIYSPDQFGYSPRYAIDYTQTEFPSKIGYPFEKRSVTYVLVAPPPRGQEYLNPEWWMENQVRITREPDETRKLQGGYILERYNLSDEEVAIESDPNILHDLHFR